MEEINTTSGWSQRRKEIYAWSTVFVLALFSFFIFYKFWYRAPLCTDGLQNGDETGVDCGGSCSLVCSAQALAPVITSDPRIFQIYPGVYSIVTFVENHNIDSSSYNIPYKFKVYDSSGALLTERDGVTSLIKNKTTAVFDGNVAIASGTPTRVVFELSPNITWVKDLSPSPQISITNSPILNASTSPKIEATVENNSISTVKNIEVVAVVLDGKDNAVAASRTVVDSLAKNASQNIFFTWPKPFKLAENICEKPERVVLAIDRSGSIAKSLPGVKLAAEDFISELRDGDKAGLVSFANSASNPPESLLTSDFASLKSIIDKISIATDGLQYTNISDAVSSSAGILSLDDNASANKVIVLLTDGIANKPGSVAEAESLALSEASKAKSQGINIYTIGLGQDIHRSFLQNLAASSTGFFSAPTSSDLKGIYEQISSSICKEVPARIEILYRILN